MINHSENIWSEGSEAYSKEKKNKAKKCTIQRTRARNYTQKKTR